MEASPKTTLLSNLQKLGPDVTPDQAVRAISGLRWIRLGPGLSQEDYDSVHGKFVVLYRNRHGNWQKWWAKRDRNRIWQSYETMSQDDWTQYLVCLASDYRKGDEPDVDRYR